MSTMYRRSPAAFRVVEIAAMDGEKALQGKPRRGRRNATQFVEPHCIQGHSCLGWKWIAIWIHVIYPSKGERRGMECA